jgi:hypothetical protein
LKRGQALDLQKAKEEKEDKGKNLTRHGPWDRFWAGEQPGTSILTI